jgi:hypothetical protein
MMPAAVYHANLEGAILVVLTAFARKAYVVLHRAFHAVGVGAF